MGIKRTVGQRGKSLFDLIDLEIINILVKEDCMSILELRKKLRDIKYANLKKHLDRLESKPLQLIKRESVPKSRRILISLKKDTLTKERVRVILDIFGDKLKP